MYTLEHVEIRDYKEALLHSSQAHRDHRDPWWRKTSKEQKKEESSFRKHRKWVEKCVI